MDDKIVTFSVGKVGVILTRKMLLYAAFVLTAILAIYAFVWVESQHDHVAGKWAYLIVVSISGISWAAYTTDVGHAAWLRNSRLAEQLFVQKY